MLRNAGVETHLVMSKTAELTFAYETTLKIADVSAAAIRAHDIDDMAAADRQRLVPRHGHDRRALLDPIDV